MIDAELPLVFTRRQARLLGFTDHAIRWRVHRETWWVLRRGVFCTADSYADATSAQRSLLASLALSISIGAGEVISHLSAAIAYGWPAPLDLDPTPWTTVAPGAVTQTRRRDGRIRQVAPFVAGDVIRRGDVLLTSPARTVADCLRHLRPDASVPISDAALAAGVDKTGIARVLERQVDWPYAARGNRSARWVDGLRESWLESRSAVAFHQASVPSPQSQAVILDERGRSVARVDFLWAATGVIGEADGWGKYDVAPASSATTQRERLQVLRDEKEREDRLRDLGWEVVRWTTPDVLGPRPALMSKLDRAFARARPDRLCGSWRPTPPPPVRGHVPAVGLVGLESLADGRPIVLPTDARWSRYGGNQAG